jgi:autotransporter-associated beta strand protein
LNSGTLLVGSDQALGSGTLSMMTGGVLASTGTDARTLANALLLGNQITLGDTLKNGVLTFQGNGVSASDTELQTASDVTFGGNLSGNANLRKTGIATLTLNGANTYTGLTQIDSGTLALGSAASLASGTISLASGATIRRRKTFPAASL